MNRTRATQPGDLTFSPRLPRPYTFYNIPAAPVFPWRWSIDGVVGGLWQRRRAGKVLRMQVEAFSQLSGRRRTMLEAQAARVGEILGLRGELAFGPVEARPHL